jgi:predicted  nucleic acid-binding Zn-ribbon protein
MEQTIFISGVAAILNHLSALFSLSSNTDAKYAISRMLNEISGVYAEISSENMDQEKIRKQLGAISQELQKFRDQQAERNAPAEMLRIAADASQSIAQITSAV